MQGGEGKLRPRTPAAAIERHSQSPNMALHARVALSCQMSASTALDRNHVQLAAAQPANSC
jgi:hypothetical protein